MKAPSLPLAAFVSCALIWGSTFLAIRIGNDTLPPMWACAIRFLLAAIILNGLVFLRGQRWPKGPAMTAAFLFGLLEFGISMPLLYWGELVVPSGLAAVFFAVCPIVSMLLARAFKMETLSAVRLGAGVLAFGGVAIVFWGELMRGGSTMGMLAIFLAAVSAASAGIFLQRGPKQDAIATNAVGVVIGFVCVLLISLIKGEPRPIPSGFKEVFPVIYLAVLGSVVAFGLFAWLITRWRATTAAFIGVIVPVIAVILGAIARNEALAPGSLVGAFVVVVGVTIALRSETKNVAAVSAS